MYTQASVSQIAEQSCQLTVQKLPIDPKSILCERLIEASTTGLNKVFGAS